MSAEPAAEPPRSERERESDTETSSRLTVLSCPACGTILTEDTTTDWSGECPSCHRVNDPEEVFD